MAPITNILYALLAATSIQALPTLESRNTGRPAADSPEFSALVRSAPTAIDRFRTLFTKGEGDNIEIDQALVDQTFKFSFGNAQPAGNGGTVKSANVGNFPILAGLGIAKTSGVLNACSINTPHVHPRASEFLTVIAGAGLEVGMILENGIVTKEKASREVKTHLAHIDAAVFPVGSIHYQFNPYCTPVSFLAALSSADPGTGQIAQNFFGLNQEVVSATLGWGENVEGRDVAAIKDQLPDNLVQGVAGCLKRCEGQI